MRLNAVVPVRLVTRTQLTSAIALAAILEALLLLLVLLRGRAYAVGRSERARVGRRSVANSHRNPVANGARVKPAVREPPAVASERESICTMTTRGRRERNERACM